MECAFLLFVEFGDFRGIHESQVVVSAVLEYWSIIYDVVEQIGNPDEPCSVAVVFLRFL